MKIIRLLGIFLFFTLTAFGIHKFYIAIYQINFVQEKKRIEITTRIFADDLNLALKRRFHQEFHIGDAGETEDEVEKMNQYLMEHFHIKVDGIPKSILFLSKEMESNVVVGYYKINDVTSIKSLSIENSSLMEVYPDQQNIMQTNFNGKKQSLLLTSDHFAGVLK